MDKTYSDERRIKQILITILSNTLKTIIQGNIILKINLDKGQVN